MKAGVHTTCGHIFTSAIFRYGCSCSCFICSNDSSKRHIARLSTYLFHTVHVRNNEFGLSVVFFGVALNISENLV